MDQERGRIPLELNVDQGWIKAPTVVLKGQAPLYLHHLVINQPSLHSYKHVSKSLIQQQCSTFI